MPGSRPPTMKIRPATNQDLPAIGQIYRQFLADSAPLSMAFWESLLAAQGLIVAEVDDRVVGFGTVDLQANEQIRQLYVDPAFQGKGIGGRILTRLEEIAQTGGLDRLTLHATPGAVAFYQRAGYNPIAIDGPSDHDHDGVMMAKILSGSA